MAREPGPVASIGGNAFSDVASQSWTLTELKAHRRESSGLQINPVPAIGSGFSGIQLDVFQVWTAPPL